MFLKDAGSRQISPKESIEEGIMFMPFDLFILPSHCDSDDLLGGHK